MQAKRARRVLAAVAAIVATAVMMTAAPAQADVSGSNKTVFIYDTQSGVAAIGTLSGGSFLQQQTVYVGTGYTHAAASRDTLMLYNTNTGAVQTGFLQGGYYSFVQDRSLGAGWTHLTASCDSYLLYHRPSGYKTMGTLRSGVMSQTSYGPGFSAGWDQITSSCDTIRFEMSANHVTALGRLVGGGFAQTNSYSDPGSNTPFTHATSTSDSFLKFAAPWGYGYWGSAVNGGDGYSNSASSFSTGWDILAGSGDTVLFYDKDSGAAATSIVSSGQYSYRNSYGFSAGWDVIAGGK